MESYATEKTEGNFTVSINEENPSTDGFFRGYVEFTI